MRKSHRRMNISETVKNSTVHVSAKSAARMSEPAVRQLPMRSAGESPGAHVSQPFVHGGTYAASDPRT